MKKFLLNSITILLILLTNSSLNAQVDQNTYAVVVGVSSYQDTNIVNLKYADKDALAFAQFLNSEAGGNLKHEELHVLVNEEATYGNVASALTKLLSQVKAGDKVIIYFSGHGDVESSLDSKPGYLLLWDATQSNYIFGGALPINTLQSIISTLSANATVIVVADACRSGNLAGGTEGQEITGATLASKIQNEIKILSCQANELSLEGEKWGGGHGAFSYYLVKGLYGLADKNNSFDVTLGELEDYLEDNVTNEVLPHIQNPDIEGLNSVFLTHVFPELLDSVKAADTLRFDTDHSELAARGFAEEVMQTSSESIDDYNQFLRTLEAHQFFTPEQDCAEWYYSKLEEDEKLNDLMPTVKLKYAAALQNNAQQVLNNILNSDMNELIKSKESKINTYQDFPQQLQRASTLLGENHFMDSTLIGRKLFFEGYIMTAQNNNYDTVVGRKSLNKLFRSLDYLPTTAISYLYISKVYGYNMNMPDSSQYYAELAAQYAPQWELPYTSMSYIFSRISNDPIKAELFLKKADQIDSNSIFVLNAWGNHLAQQGKNKEAVSKYESCLEKDSLHTKSMSNLAALWIDQGKHLLASKMLQRTLRINPKNIDAQYNLGILERNSKRPFKAIQRFKKAISLDPTYTKAYIALADIYIQQDKLDKGMETLTDALNIDSTKANVFANIAFIHLISGEETLAESHYKKAISLDPNLIDPYSNLGLLFINQKRYEEASTMIYNIIEIDPSLPTPYFDLACIASLQNNIEEGFTQLERSLQNGWQDKATLLNDESLDNLRQKKMRWNDLMIKYQFY